MRLAVSALTLLLAAPLAAHVRHAQNPAAAQKVHKVEKLAEGVYCIYGEGGNIGLVVTKRYAILIDDQFEKLLPGLKEAIRSVTDKPIKYVINTHWHGDHTGGNRMLENQVVAIVAHANARTRLMAAQAAEPKAERGGLPEITVGEADPEAMARLDIHLDGTDLHLVHYKPGHTDGDIIVGLPQVHVMHMGDLFFNGLTPYIDLKSGGSLAGMLANVEWVLSFIPDDTRLIPGHGPTGGKKELTRFRDFLKAVQAHVAAHPGKTGAELDASFDHKAWSDYQDLKPFLDWASFFELAAGRMPKR